MKRVLLYSAFYYPSVGGTERATYLLAQQLVNHNYNVTIVTQTSSLNDELTDYALPGVPIYRNPNLARFWNLCTRHDVMIVNGGFSVRAWLGVMPVPIPVVLIHAMITSGMRAKDTLAGRLGNMLRERMKSQCIHVGVSSEVLRSAGVSGRIIPNMIGPEILNSAENLSKGSPKKYDGIFVGRLIESKGLAHILNVIALLKNQGRSVTLAVVGDGPFREKAEELCVQYELTTVHFLGNKSPEELATLYAESKILLHTPTAPEGFGMGLIEAMAFGVPVLVNAQPALPETSGDAGVVVPTNAPEQTAQAWIRLLDNHTSYKELSTRALQRARMYHPEKVFQYWDALLHEISI